VDYRTLGRSGLKVSRGCLGGMNFGLDDSSPAGEAESARIIGAFLDAGHNFVDTANAYRGGQSEEVIGRALRGKRDGVVLATKAAMPIGPGPNDRGLSRAYLVRALDASLRRLDTDHIDLYQCHLWDGETPIEETMATLDEFVRAGKVLHIGCSNFTAAQIVESQWAAERVGARGFVSLQPHYSLLAREIEAEILPTCRRHGLGVMAYGPLGGGVLAGRYTRGAAPGPGSRLGQWKAMPYAQPQKWADDLLAERNFDIADEVLKVAGELDTTPVAVALAWVAGRPDVSSVIIGPRTVEQLKGNLDGFRLDLPAELADRLEEVSRAGNVPVSGQMGVV
jgi:aryl-alcohol dehydrogenase-like predicted oxidoreductase